jgi:hypothetical protein
MTQLFLLAAKVAMICFSFRLAVMAAAPIVALTLFPLLVVMAARSHSYSHFSASVRD